MGLFALAVLWLGVTHCCGATEGAPRGLLGTVVEFTSQERGFFGLSGAEELLVESRTACEEPLTIGQRANLGLLCGWAGRARGCLRYSDTEPVWEARWGVEQYLRHLYLDLFEPVHGLVVHEVMNAIMMVTWKGFSLCYVLGGSCEVLWLWWMGMAYVL